MELDQAFVLVPLLQMPMVVEQSAVLVCFSELHGQSLLGAVVLGVHIDTRLTLAHLVDHHSRDDERVMDVVMVDGLVLLLKFHRFELSQNVISRGVFEILAHFLRLNLIELVLDQHLLEIVVFLHSFSGFIAEVLVHLA